ncbi:MAG TPA: hypothetical protein PK095_06425, partial [Myxococcota bacterium]|nr:hypothetical protein [Myxococcota bacterium]
YEKQHVSLDYYEKTALLTADLLLSNAQKAFRAGDVGYLEYAQALGRANDVGPAGASVIWRLGDKPLDPPTPAFGHFAGDTILGSRSDTPDTP